MTTWDDEWKLEDVAEPGEPEEMAWVRQCNGDGWIATALFPAGEVVKGETLKVAGWYFYTDIGVEGGPHKNARAAKLAAVAWKETYDREWDEHHERCDEIRDFDWEYGCSVKGASSLSHEDMWELSRRVHALVMELRQRAAG